MLLLGESGTGKELFAQAIHCASPRQAGPFVPIDNRTEWSEIADLQHTLFPGADHPEETARCCYPFHPATVRAVPELADKLGTSALYLETGDARAPCPHCGRGA